MDEYNTLYQNDLRHILKLNRGMKKQQNSELVQIQEIPRNERKNNLRN